MDAIQTIPPIPSGLQDAALRGTLVPFVGAGASRLAGCPNWTEFADAALRYFVDNGKFSHAQLDQLSQQSPRVKLSIALGLEREHNLQIDFQKILYPKGDESPKGRRLYNALSKLGTTFVTTNYDKWLDTVIGDAPVSVTNPPRPSSSPPTEGRTSYFSVTDFTPEKLSHPHTVFHLHGSMLAPESMIMTTQHYVQHYANDRLANGKGQENNVLTFLDYLFRQRNVLFVGYGLEELEVLEYVIGKARLAGEPGAKEMRHYLLQGFFSHEEQLARSLASYYREFGIELVPFLRDNKDWDQLIEVLEAYARLTPAESLLTIQKLTEMEALLEE